MHIHVYKSIVLCDCHTCNYILQKELAICNYQTLAIKPILQCTVVTLYTTRQESPHPASGISLPVSLGVKSCAWGDHDCSNTVGSLSVAYWGRYVPQRVHC